MMGARIPPMYDMDKSEAENLRILREWCDPWPVRAWRSWRRKRNPVEPAVPSKLDADPNGDG